MNLCGTIRVPAPDRPRVSSCCGAGVVVIGLTGRTYCQNCGERCETTLEQIDGEVRSEMRGVEPLRGIFSPGGPVQPRQARGVQGEEKL